MEKTENDQKEISESALKTSALDLRGRQSVRATFRLSEDCIDAISILAVQLGIKQKSVFDHLMEDAQVLKNVAREVRDTDFDRQERIQKTFVISRRSLSFLDSVSSTHNAPRDALVEYSIRRLLPIIASERKKHETRKKLLAEISDHYTDGEELIAKAKELLGADDRIVRKLESAQIVYQNAFDDIANFIEKSKVLEEFQIE